MDIQITLRCDIFCSVCRAALICDNYDTVNRVLVIEPCATCMDDEHSRGYEAGKAAGSLMDGEKAEIIADVEDVMSSEVFGGLGCGCAMCQEHGTEGGG